MQQLLAEIESHTEAGNALLSRVKSLVMGRTILMPHDGLLRQFTVFAVDSASRFSVYAYMVPEGGKAGSSIVYDFPLADVFKNNPNLSA
jgi:hypothetical protein